MISLAALLLAWVFALSPVLSDRGAWLPAELMVAIYPPMSAALAAIGCSLAFDCDRRSPSHQFLFVGTLCLVVGDTLFAMKEAGRLNAGRVYELPFLFSASCFGAAALHRSMRYLNRPSARWSGNLTWARIAMLSLALLLPAAVAGLNPPAANAAKAVLVGILVALAAAAVARLVLSIIAQSKSQQHLTHQATHDDLTGLPNRDLAVRHITECLQRDDPGPGQLSVMFADLDQFKLINDSMGHAIGDELLIAAARRLSAAVRDGDLVARISGDEFLVVCDNVSREEAHALASRVRGAFAEPFALSSTRIYVSTSIGVAVAEHRETEDATSLVRDADTAMYASKGSGRNTITFFDLRMRERVARRVALEQMMRQALDAGEIVAHFQPIATLPAGQVEGFEVLARWTHEGESISPVDFIPVAEESGLIVQLGESMLEQACGAVARWRKTLAGGAHIYVSVNLSPRQLLDSDVVDTVEHILARWGLPGDALWLEITEGVMLEDSVETHAVLNGLCDLGVRLSVDDFGTGFSSLSYLRKYPLSKVKIDRSFVQDLDTRGGDQSLVVAVIGMAATLGMTTIAEGVERAAEADRLFEYGCSAAQGHYFAPPRPAEEVPALVAPLGFTPAPSDTLAVQDG
ncbi:MAG: EAL domain-containing protein [Ilumatobacteraceae bacterium]